MSKLYERFYRKSRNQDRDRSLDVGGGIDDRKSQDMKVFHRRYEDDDRREIKQRYFSIDTIIATYFWLGKIPLIQGTAGALGAYPLFWSVVYMCHGTNLCIEKMLYVVIVILLIIGGYGIHKYQKRIKKHDHSSVVIDEVIGQLLTIVIALDGLSLLHSSQVNFLYLSFDNFIFFYSLVVFRFFDIRKPLGIKFIDRCVGSFFGVILDDIIAAVYAGITIIGVSTILYRVL